MPRLKPRGPDFADLRKANAKLWYGVLEEDIFVVEGMQKGPPWCTF